MKAMQAFIHLRHCWDSLGVQSWGQKAVRKMTSSKYRFKIRVNCVYFLHYRPQQTNTDSILPDFLSDAPGEGKGRFLRMPAETVCEPSMPRLLLRRDGDSGGS